MNKHQSTRFKKLLRHVGTDTYIVLATNNEDFKFSTRSFVLGYRMEMNVQKTVKQT
jgi:hypothetical protein